MSASKAKPDKDTVTVEADFFEALMAAIGPNHFNMSSYKKMAEYITSGRTVNSLEHFFRDRKKKAFALLAAEAGNDGDNELDEPASVKTPPPKRSARVAENQKSKGLEVSPIDGRMKRIPKTRKRKTAVKDEDEEVAEPLAKKVKEEANDFA